MKQELGLYLEYKYVSLIKKNIYANVLLCEVIFKKTMLTL